VRPGQAVRPPTRVVDVADEGELTEDLSSRWMSLICAIGVGMVAVVAVQVIASIVEGLTARASRQEPTGVPTDLLHRLGFPFGNLGPPTALFLVIGLVLVCVPLLLRRHPTEFQNRLINLALVAIVVLSIVIAIGSLLAVRNSLHEYTARGNNPPTFARVGFASFLLGTLGTLAVALFGSLAALNIRRRTR
jgi:TRAP-type C4-dicarboxylate transport system permease small subunit